MDTEREIRLVKRESDGWVAIEEGTGATATAETRREALADLDAVAAERSEAPLGERLRGLADGLTLDVDPVEAVRNARERI